MSDRLDQMEAERDHLLHLSALIELEAQREAERLSAQRAQLTPQPAEQSGHSLVERVVTDARLGLGGPGRKARRCAARG